MSTYVFEQMIGKVFTSVTSTEDTLTFVCNEGEFVFYHEQDCCEDVHIEDIVGDLDDLVDSPLVMAEEVSREELWDENEFDHTTWTFYKFATIKGYVDVRWHGSSNGYYSESVDFKWVQKC